MELTSTRRTVSFDEIISLIKGCDLLRIGRVANEKFVSDIKELNPNRIELSFLNSTSVIKLSIDREYNDQKAYVDEDGTLHFFDSVGFPNTLHFFFEKKCGDLDSELPPAITTIQVDHWDTYPAEKKEFAFEMEIDDRRKSSGQACITLGVSEGKLDEMISILMEVSSSPLNQDEDVVTARVSFDGDNMAFSLVRYSEKILLVPEPNIQITSAFIEEIKQYGYWIDSKITPDNN